MRYKQCLVAVEHLAALQGVGMEAGGRWETPSGRRENRSSDGTLLYLHIMLTRGPHAVLLHSSIRKLACVQPLIRSARELTAYSLVSTLGGVSGHRSAECGKGSNHSGRRLIMM